MIILRLIYRTMKNIKTYEGLFDFFNKKEKSSPLTKKSDKEICIIFLFLLICCFYIHLVS